VRIAVVAALLVACTQPPPGEPAADSEVVVKALPQVSSPTLDLLWVIDTSPAIQAQRAMIASNIAAAAATLDPAVFDVSITAITAGATPRGRVASQGLPDVVVATDLAGETTALTDVAPASSSSANAAIAAAAAATATAWRTGAQHAIIFIAATDDESPGAPTDYDLGSGTRVFAIVDGAAPRFGSIATAGTTPLADGFASALPLDAYATQTLGAPCLDVAVSACSVEEQATSGGSVIAACDDGGAVPCWRLVSDAATCPSGGGAYLQVDYANPEWSQQWRDPRGPADATLVAQCVAR
jgi:hypothetical protein